MTSTPFPYRVGPDEFHTDTARLQRALSRYDEGKGLIGGDPSLRPRWLHPLPLEPASCFRLHQSSQEHLARLQSFLQAAPLEVEIGSARGDFVLDWAERHPHRHFLAFEVKWKLMRRIHRLVDRRGITNLWLSDDDARYDLPRLLQPGSVDVFHILFPDPWWKPKHQARRLFVEPFIDVLALLLADNGILRVASDVPGYIEHIAQIVAGHPEFTPHQQMLSHRFADAHPTHRQAFCDEISRPYTYLYFRKHQPSHPCGEAS